MIQTFRTGGDRNLGYLAADESAGECLVIDPSYDPLSIVSYAHENGLRILYAFNTHDHADHTNGNAAFQRACGVQPLQWRDREPLTQVLIDDGATLPLGRLTVHILHTPGHTPDSICIWLNGAVFTGDTLFVGKVGGTDLGDGARQEYDSLHRKLLTLPPETRIYPGHDVGTTLESTLGHERETNPFLQQPDFAAFLHLKANWAAYKKEHGIA
ncbi:MAG TPA: MBL fold metallo-hydrolase [Candidatus Acetothermia bacterium]|nr:MBL fold metallo-hydrolase [Candidatus Acetothermia bacterium]